MKETVREFVDKLYKEVLNDEENGYIGGVNHFTLTDEEANIVDEAIRLYKLPFAISEDNSGITDLEANEFYRFDEDAFDYIAEAVLEDDGNLLDEGNMSEENQKILYKFLILY